MIRITFFIELTHYLLLGIIGYFSLEGCTPGIITERLPINKNSHDIFMQIGRIAMIVHLIGFFSY